MKQFYFDGWDADRGAYAVNRDYAGESRQGHRVAWFIQEDEARQYAEYRNHMLRLHNTDNVAAY